MITDGKMPLVFNFVYVREEFFICSEDVQDQDQCVAQLQCQLWHQLHQWQVLDYQDHLFQ